MKKYIVCFVTILSLLFAGPAKADIIKKTEEAAAGSAAVLESIIEAVDENQTVVCEAQKAADCQVRQTVNDAMRRRMGSAANQAVDLKTFEALQPDPAQEENGEGNGLKQEETGPGIEAKENADSGTGGIQGGQDGGAEIAGNAKAGQSGEENRKEQQTESGNQPGPGQRKESKQPSELKQPSESTSQSEPEPQEEQQIQGNRWGVVLSAEEKDLLARITMLEAGSESDLGQQAVVEVILNRVYSPEYPNTVYGVLSQVDGGYRQFTTWKSRNSRAAAPSARVWANVEAVLQGKTRIFPYKTVYFSRKGENRRVQARIGGHVFCNR